MVHKIQLKTESLGKFMRACTKSTDWYNWADLEISLELRKN